MSIGVIASHAAAAGGGGGGGRAAFLAQQIADGALVVWGMDETSGTTRNDDTGNGRNATAAATISAGASLHSDGDGHSMALVKSFGGYATIPSASWQYPASGNLTIECVIKFTGNPGASGDELVHKFAGANYHFYRNSSGNLAFELSTSAGATRTLNSSFALANNVVWYLAATKDSSDLRVYAGVVGANDFALAGGWGSNFGNAAVGAGIWSTSSQIQIGRGANDASIPTALMDSVAMYGTADSLATLTARYALI